MAWRAVWQNGAAARPHPAELVVVQAVLRARLAVAVRAGAVAGGALLQDRVHQLQLRVVQQRAAARLRSAAVRPLRVLEGFRGFSSDPAVAVCPAARRCMPALSTSAALGFASY